MIPIRKVPRRLQANQLQDVQILDHQDLARDSIKLSGLIARKWPDCDAIAGVPRSGMLAASHIATNLGLPLYECYEGELCALGGGRRIRSEIGHKHTRIIVVEDSINSGWSIQRSVSKHRDPRILGTAAVYSTPNGAACVDLVAVDLPLPHYFMWHMFGSNLLCKHPTGFDIDGLFCPDCTPYDDDDGDRYGEFILNTPPLYLYRGGVCGAIITGRLEKYRPQTETWLKLHNVQYKQLIMGPWESKRERARHSVGDWKGGVCKELKLQLYVESDPRQAPRIATSGGIPVMCPDAKKVFVP
jgi:hypothetical protein